MLTTALEELFNTQAKSITNSDRSFRSKAWDQFQSLGFPTKKTEGFEYLPLDKLKKQTFVSGVIPACFEHEIIDTSLIEESKDSCILMIDGKYCEELSNIPEGLVVTNLLDAKKQFGPFIKGRQAELSLGKSSFRQLNLALSNEGLFIYIPKGKVIEKPLQILHVISGNFMVYPTIFCYVGKEAQIDIIHSCNHISNLPSLLSLQFDVCIEEGARCKLHEMQFLSSSQHFLFSDVSATVKRDGYFQTLLLTRGSEIHRNAYDVQLTDENANCDLRGLSMLSSSNHSHVHAKVSHKQKNTYSNQHFKSLVDDRSRFSFEGKIFVEQQAVGTSAYQLNNNLLISDDSAAFSKPGLEIFADDVKASHGSTTTKINEDEHFYLLSRGLNEEQAAKLLVKAFTEEIISKLNIKGIRDVAENIFTL